MFTASGWPLSFGCAVRWVSLRARVTSLADLSFDGHVDGQAHTLVPAPLSIHHVYQVPTAPRLRLTINTLHTQHRYIHHSARERRRNEGGGVGDRRVIV